MATASEETVEELTPWQQVGQRLRTTRGWCQASRREVAAKCGFSVSTLARLENGRQLPLPVQMLRLSEALSASIEFLILGMEPPTPRQVAWMPLNWTLNQVSRKQAKKVLALVEGTLSQLTVGLRQPAPRQHPAGERQSTDRRPGGERQPTEQSSAGKRPAKDRQRTSAPSAPRRRTTGR